MGAIQGYETLDRLINHMSILPKPPGRIAISVYVLVAILKKELELEASMYEILQVLGVMLFEKTPIKSLFSTDLNNFSKSDLHKQLLLFNF